MSYFSYYPTVWLPYFGHGYGVMCFDPGCFYCVNLRQSRNMGSCEGYSKVHDGHFVRRRHVRDNEYLLNRRESREETCERRRVWKEKFELLEDEGPLFVTFVGVRVDLHLFGKLIFDIASDLEGEGSPVSALAGEAWSYFISFDKYRRRSCSGELRCLREELIGIIDRCDVRIRQSVGVVASGESSIAAAKTLLSCLFGIDSDGFSLESWMARYDLWRKSRGNFG